MFCGHSDVADFGLNIPQGFWMEKQGLWEKFEGLEKTVFFDT